MNPALCAPLPPGRHTLIANHLPPKPILMTFLWIIPEAAFLALSLSLDTFVAGLSYGSSKIRLPLICAVTVSLVCSGVLCLSMLAGALVRPFLSPIAARLICFLLLVCMGTASDSRSSDQILSVPSRWLFQKFHVPCPAFPVFSLRLRRSL